MDLVTGTYEEISAGQEMHRLTGKHGSTAEVFKEVRETIVSQEHQELMKRFLDTSTLAAPFIFPPKKFPVKREKQSIVLSAQIPVGE